MSDDRIFVRFRGRTLGPLDEARVNELIQRGQITRLHELSADGLTWSRADEFRNFFQRPTDNKPHASEEASSEKSERLQAQDMPMLSQGTSQTPDRTDDANVDWFAHLDGSNIGPMSTLELHRNIQSGIVREGTLVWKGGFDEWVEAKTLFPDMFGPQLAAASPEQTRTHPDNVSSDLRSLAVEFNRRRSWAFFYGSLLIALGGLQALAKLLVIIVNRESSGGDAEGDLRAMTEVFLAALVITAGILVIRYCLAAKEFYEKPTVIGACRAAQRLNAFWTFCGITGLVLLVTVLVLVSIAMAIGEAALQFMS